MAYELDLLSHSLDFRMSCLKPKLGVDMVYLLSLPRVESEGVICSEPKANLQRRIKKIHKKAVSKVMVHWQGTLVEDATWEILHTL